MTVCALQKPGSHYADRIVSAVVTVRDPVRQVDHHTHRNKSSVVTSRGPVKD